MGVRVDSGRPHRRRPASNLPAALPRQPAANPETGTAYTSISTVGDPMTTAPRRNPPRPSLGSVRLALTGVAAALPLLATFACGGDTGPATATRADSAGIEIITNTGTDRPLGWTLDSILALRAPTEAGGDTVGFFDVTDVAVTSGRIVVLDRSQSALVVYDTLGHLVGRYGRKGSGPGEFSMPLYVAVALDDGVGVLDFMNRRVELFDSSFALEASVSLGSRVIGSSGLAFAGAEGDGMALPVRRLADGVALEDLTVTSPTDTAVVTTLHHPKGKNVEFKSCGLRVGGGAGLPPFFSPNLVWTADAKGDVLVSDGTTYDVDIYGADGFSPIRHVRRDLPPIEGTEDLAIRSLGEGMKVNTPAGQLVCDPKDVVEQQGFAPVIPPVVALKVSPGGDIWVDRWVPKGDPPMLDVFDSTGVYRGTLTGVDMPVAFLGDDRLILKHTDELDVPYLTVYRISG